MYPFIMDCDKIKQIYNISCRKSALSICNESINPVYQIKHEMQLHNCLKVMKLFEKYCNNDKAIHSE